MTEEEEISKVNEPEPSKSEGEEVEEEEAVKEEVKMQFILYVLIFFAIYYCSWIVPLVTFLVYAIFFLKDMFLDVSNFLVIFTNPYAFLGFVTIPLALLACYLIRLFFLALSTRLIWRFTEKMLPSKPGVIPRNVRSRAADYYHLRSFMIKYGKNIFIKGAFPWLSNWFYNFVGSSKIQKGSSLEESVLNDRFIEIGKNCYVGCNSTLATHLLTGIFGNINYFPIKLGNNVTTSGMNQIGPGSEIKDNASLLPLASTSKHSFL